MPIAFILLLVSIAIVPGLAIVDGVVGQSLASILSASALAFVGSSARAADVNVAAQVTRGLRFAAAVPAIWMVIQILPLPALSHSIWSYANEALNQNSWGHISVDLGNTFAALAQYLANIALIVVALFTARDRRRAELILFTVVVFGAITIVVLLGARLNAGSAAADINEMLSGISALGIILSLTVAIWVFERYETRHAESKGSRQNIRIATVISGAGLLTSVAGLAVGATLNVVLAAAFGIVTFGSVQAVRRLGLGGWAIPVFVVTMVTAAAMIIVWRYDAARMISPFLQFASAASRDSISVTQRILSDTAWQGTGAGTYPSLLPIYQETGGSVARASSTAAKLSIELGWPMTLFVIAVAIGLIVRLYRGALVRGRDSFYPAAASACTVIVLYQSFCDMSLLYACVAVIINAVIGLGLAQSLGQRESP